MITTPNPYLQLYFDFLKRNGNEGFVYLLTYETDDYTVLQYSSDHEYLQNEEFLASLPYARIYNQVAQQWWQLLAEQGLLQLHSTVAQTGPTQSPDDSVTSNRRVKLQPEAEQKLYMYLEQQLMGACPSAVRCCQQLNELYGIATTFTGELNDRIQQAMVDSLSEVVLSPLSNPAAQQPVALLNVWPWGKMIGKHVDYTFFDGVVVSNVQENHRRPLEFAGIWVELPDNKVLELPVQLGFTDSRQQVVAALNEAQSHQLTTQWCLEHSFRQLVLDPSLRQILEEYGIAEAAQPNRRWLSSGQLMADLALCFNIAHRDNAPQRFEIDYNDLDLDMGSPVILGGDNSKLPF